MYRPFLFAAALLAMATGLQADTGVGLVIANERYTAFPAARGAAPAARVAGSLRGAGFAVVAGNDMRANELRAAFAELAGTVSNGRHPRVVVMLSGHFVHSERDVWLLAADADAPGIGQIDVQGLRLGAVLEVAGALPGGAVIMLGHAPRSLALGPMLRAGIPELRDIPQGVTVLRGPAEQLAGLAEGLVRPGSMPVHLAASTRFVQISGFSSTLVPFIPEGGIDPQAAAGSAARAAEEERAAWAAADRAGTAEAYEGYIAVYPEGRFAMLARAALERLAADPERREAAMNLSRADRRTVQQDLTVLGFDTRGVDGIFGQGTRNAVGRWQARRGLAQTGFIDPDQRALLAADAERRRAELAEEDRRQQLAREQADRAFWQDSNAARGDEAGLRAYLSRYPEGVFAAVARDRLQEIETERRRAAEERDRLDWEAARDLDTAGDYRAYLRVHPEGRFAAQAQARLRQLTGEPAPEPDTGPTEAQIAADRDEEAALGLNRLVRSLIEGQLAVLGFEPGRIDGGFDADTRAAIVAYQVARGIPASGYLSRATANRLIAEGLPLRFD